MEIIQLICTNCGKPMKRISDGYICDNCYLTFKRVNTIEIGHTDKPIDVSFIDDYKKFNLE